MFFCLCSCFSNKRCTQCQNKQQSTKHRNEKCDPPSVSPSKAYLHSPVVKVVNQSVKQTASSQRIVGATENKNNVSHQIPAGCSRDHNTFASSQSVLLTFFHVMINVGVQNETNSSSQSSERNRYVFVFFLVLCCFCFQTDDAHNGKHKTKHLKHRNKLYESPWSPESKRP